MYSINIANISSIDGTFVIFQEPAESDLKSLAWRTINLHPHQNGTISWEMEYGFVCGECESLEPGVIFKSDLTVPADVSKNNEITCNPIDGKCNFDDPRNGNDDTFTIVEVDNIAIDKLALGISIHGSPIFIAQAQPTAQLEIPEVNKRYFVSFGKFQNGEVLDLAKLLPSAASIDFIDGSQSMDVKYEANGSWSVSSKQEKTPIFS